MAADVHDYERCDKWAHKTRCPNRAFVYTHDEKQWCQNHAPQPDPATLRAIHALRDAGLVTSEEVARYAGRIA